MSAVSLPRLHHIALTVTDVDVSVNWYEEVFGVRHQMDAPHEGGVGKVLSDETRALTIVLHRHDANDGGLFGETSTGLDHAGFLVPRRAEAGFGSRESSKSARVSVKPCTRDRATSPTCSG